MRSDRTSNSIGCTAGTCINVTEPAHCVTGSDESGDWIDCVVGQIGTVGDVKSDCIG